LGEIDCCWFGLKLALSILNVLMGGFYGQPATAEAYIWGLSNHHLAENAIRHKSDFRWSA
jgi:hypothetical protein